jgi:hypothetical protein
MLGRLYRSRAVFAPLLWFEQLLSSADDGSRQQMQSNTTDAVMQQAASPHKLCDQFMKPSSMRLN